MGSISIGDMSRQLPYPFFGHFLVVKIKITPFINGWGPPACKKHWRGLLFTFGE